MSITTENLFVILNNEKRTGELISLDEDFYEKIYNNINEITDENERKTIISLVNEIKTKRIQKLLIYIAYKKTLPIKIPKEEKELYEKINAIINDDKARVVKIIKDTPELIMPNGTKIGPFKSGQTIIINDDIKIEFIIKNGIGNEVKL